jgi:hypothetical protein
VRITASLGWLITSTSSTEEIRSLASDGHSLDSAGIHEESTNILKNAEALQLKLGK